MYLVDGRGVTIVSCESTCSYTGYQPTHGNHDYQLLTMRVTLLGAVDHGAFVPIVGGAYYYTTDTSACELLMSCSCNRVHISRYQ